MKNRDPRPWPAAIRHEAARKHSPYSQGARRGEEATAEDPATDGCAHTITSKGSVPVSRSRARAASAIVDVSSTALGSSTSTARRSRAMARAGSTSDRTSLYAAAARITHAKLYAEGQPFLEFAAADQTLPLCSFQGDERHRRRHDPAHRVGNPRPTVLRWVEP